MGSPEDTQLMDQQGTAAPWSKLAQMNLVVGDLVLARPTWRSEETFGSKPMTHGGLGIAAHMILEKVGFKQLEESLGAQEAKRRDSQLLQDSNRKQAREQLDSEKHLQEEPLHRDSHEADRPLADLNSKECALEEAREAKWEAGQGLVLKSMVHGDSGCSEDHDGVNVVGALEEASVHEGDLKQPKPDCVEGLKAEKVGHGQVVALAKADSVGEMGLEEKSSVQPAERWADGLGASTGFTFLGQRWLIVFLWRHRSPVFVGDITRNRMAFLLRRQLNHAIAARPSQQWCLSGYWRTEP